MSIDVNAAMDDLGTALGTITGLRVYDYPADKVAAPAAVIGLDNIEYDHATSRNADRAAFRVYLVVATQADRVARDLLFTYLDGTGDATTSVKAALDALPEVRAVRAETAPIAIGDVTYRAGAVFDVDYIA